MTRKVLVAPSSFGAQDAQPLALLRAAGFEVVPNPYGRKLTRDELRSLLSDDIEGILAGLEPLDRGILAGSRLRAISRVGAGLSNVDVEAAVELGIAVRTTPDAPTDAVAELTLGALLCLLRQISSMDQSLHAGAWEKRIGAQLSGKTVHIIGFGRIGRRLSVLLQPFGVRLLASDPQCVAPVEGIPIVPLEVGLPQADIISVHASGERCIVGARELSLVKGGAYLLNASRGGVVDETALLEALSNGKVAGVWMDVFSDEPYRGPLLECRNALLTPHVGSYTKECRSRMEREAVGNLLDVLTHTEPVAAG